MKNWGFRAFGILLLVIALFLVRKFETQLFYDPLLEYFQQDFMNLDFPEISLGKHFASISFRFLLNCAISLGIIYLLFLNKSLLKFSAVLMLICWVVFGLLYIYFVNIEFQHAFTAGFYARRMLIQPIMLLILVPAIWFYLKKKEA